MIWQKYCAAALAMGLVSSVGAVSVAASAQSEAASEAEVPLTTGGWSGSVSMTWASSEGSTRATYQVDGRHQLDDNVSNYPSEGAIWEQPKLTSASYDYNCSGELEPTPEASVDGYFGVHWYRDTWHISAYSNTWFPISGPGCGDNASLPQSFGASGEHAVDAPIPRTLKGTTTETGSGVTVTLSWDLSRDSLPADTCLDHRYSTAHGTSFLNAAAAPNPDFASFALDMKWCLTPNGGVLVKNGSVTQADLSENWVLLGTLQSLGFEPYETEPVAKVTTDSVKGKATFGVKTSPFSVVVSLAPTGRLLDKAAKGLNKYKTWRELGMSHKKAKNKLDDYLRKHVGTWNDTLDTMVFETLDRVPGISKNRALEATVTISKVFQDVGAHFRAKMVDDLIGGQTRTKEVLKDVFTRRNVGLWKVKVRLTADPDGTAQFTNRTKVRIVDETWSHDTVS